MAATPVHSLALRRDSYKDACLTYQDGERRLDITLEMSGVPECDWVAATTNFDRWTNPSGVAISIAERHTIRARVNEWARAHGTRIGVTEPARLHSRREVWLKAFGACAVAAAVSMLWFDRPLAEFVQAHFHDTVLERLASAALGALTVVAFIMCAILFAATLVSISGRRLAPWARVPVLCAWSAVAAVAAAVSLKFLLGRSQVYPGYLVNHIYTWHPLRGTNAFAAFPSATMATAAAIAAPLWRLKRKLRTALLVATAFVAGGLVITNGHWLADIIGGAFLGAWLGAVVVPALSFRFRHRRFT